jgi:hypothetical protein
LHAALLALLTLTIASYSLRLSNHLVLAWFMLVVVLAADVARARGTTSAAADAVALAGVRGLMLATYALAFLHKLNAEYVDPRRSWAAQFAGFLCWDRGIRSANLVHAAERAAIYGTLVAEAAIPVLLVLPPVRPAGFAVALAFHFALALLGIVNFSAVMYAGLLAFVPAGSLDELTRLVPREVGAGTAAAVILACLVAVVAVTPRRANRHLPYRNRAAAWPIQLGYGVLVGWLTLVALVMARRPELARLTPVPSYRPFLAVVWGVYVLNGLAPYLGVKHEFSMAMFSNLRAEPWPHLLVPAGWRPFRLWRYVDAVQMTGVPPPDRLGADPAAQLAAHLLSRSAEYRFTPYFLHEAVRRIRAASGGGVPLEVIGVVGGRGGPQVVKFDGEARPWRDYVPLGLFPFAEPVDVLAPHSEQGLVVAGRTEQRQLF